MLLKDQKWNILHSHIASSNMIYASHMDFILLCSRSLNDNIETVGILYQLELLPFHCRWIYLVLHRVVFRLCKLFRISIWTFLWYFAVSNALPRLSNIFHVLISFSSRFHMCFEHLSEALVVWTALRDGSSGSDKQCDMNLRCCIWYFALLRAHILTVENGSGIWTS